MRTHGSPHPDILKFEFSILCIYHAWTISSLDLYHAAQCSTLVLKGIGCGGLPSMWWLPARSMLAQLDD
jgi:hypothetical protein